MILCGSEVLCKCETKPFNVQMSDFMISLRERAAVCGTMCLSAHVDICAYDRRLRGVLFHAFVCYP